MTLKPPRLVRSVLLETGRFGSVDLVLRSVVEPWPFPPHARVVPGAVAALDLVDSDDAGLRELGLERLGQLTSDVEPEWRQRPPRRCLLRPLVATVAAVSVQGRRPRGDAVWDDRAEDDADQLVALLFVAGASLRRAEAAELLRMPQPRLARACAVLRADAPRGLRLEEAGEQLTLVTAPGCAATVERYLGQPAPEPLSQAALEALAIVAHEQPVTRADIRAIRGVDSDAVVETLRARGLVAECPPDVNLSIHRHQALHGFCVVGREHRRSRTGDQYRHIGLVFGADRQPAKVVERVVSSNLEPQHLGIEPERSILVEHVHSDV
jgi:chromosome segregation and condensation protein ScpB